TGGTTVSAGGMLVLTGDNTSATGAIAVQNGTLRLGTGGSLAATAAVTLGNSTNSGTFILGDASGAVSTTLANLATSGSGSANQVVGGNAAASTLTISSGSAVSFGGTLGGGGANENNLNLAKDRKSVV